MAHTYIEMNELYMQNWPKCYDIGGIDARRVHI